MATTDFLLIPDIIRDGFAIRPMTEVFVENEQGEELSSLGFFVADEIAKEWIDLQSSGEIIIKTRRKLVLSNGLQAYALSDQIRLLDDISAHQEIQKKKNKKG